MNNAISDAFIFLSRETNMSNQSTDNIELQTTEIPDEVAIANKLKKPIEVETTLTAPTETVDAPVAEVTDISAPIVDTTSITDTPVAVDVPPVVEVTTEATPVVEATLVTTEEPPVTDTPVAVDVVPPVVDTAVIADVTTPVSDVTAETTPVVEAAPVVDTPPVEDTVIVTPVPQAIPENSAIITNDDLNTVQETVSQAILVGDPIPAYETVIAEKTPNTPPDVDYTHPNTVLASPVERALSVEDLTPFDPKDVVAQSPVIELTDVLPTPEVTVSRHNRKHSFKTKDEEVHNGFGLVDEDTLFNDRLERALGSLRDESMLSPDEIATAQVLLYTTLTNIFIQKEYDQVASFLTNFLQYVEHHHQGHFSSNKAFRGFNELRNVTNEQIIEYQFLLRVLIDIAPSETRQQVLKQINWEIFRNKLTQNTGSKIYAHLSRYFNLI